MTQEQKTRIEEHHDRLYHIATVDNIPDDIRDALKAAYLAGAAYALDIYCPQWISVEDELPPKDKAYLAYWQHLGVTKYRYVKAGAKVSRTFSEHITHWMPLPRFDHLAGVSKKVEKGDEE